MRRYLLLSIMFLLLLAIKPKFQTTSHTINLYTGWNLISIPLQPADTKSSSVLSSIEGKYSAVFAYDANLQSYQSYIPGESENSLTNVVAGRGYWVYMDEPGALRITGNPVSAGINLVEGWNLVGFNSTSSRPLTAAFDSIKGSYSAVYEFDAQKNSYLSYAPPDSSEISSLTPGKGYWVYAEKAALWTLPDIKIPDKKYPTVGSVVSADPSFSNIVAPDSKIEKVGSGYQFTEGPVWVNDGGLGYLLFSDLPDNSIIKWSLDGQSTVFRKPSGYNGPPIKDATKIGSNGLTLDREGRLIACEHGNRRVYRIEKDGRMTVLAERYNGKRFNGPNDVVVRSDGSIYFTDPEFGPFDKKPYEQGFEGLYRITPQGQLELLTRNINAPNGLAFSPDEKTLYLAVNSDDIKSWLAFDVLPDGKLGRSRTFFKAEGRGKKNADGLKVDKLGNLYCTGPTGLWVISPAGKHLGWIRPPELAANCAWGDPDGKTLYITAETGLYRIKLKNEGVRP